MREAWLQLGPNYPWPDSQDLCDRRVMDMGHCYRTAIFQARFHATCCRLRTISDSVGWYVEYYLLALEGLSQLLATTTSEVASATKNAFAKENLILNVGSWDLLWGKIERGRSYLHGDVMLMNKSQIFLCECLQLRHKHAQDRHKVWSLRSLIANHCIVSAVYLEFAKKTSPTDMWLFTTPDKFMPCNWKICALSIESGLL